MTPEQQRIAIAEWMGYVWYRAPQDRHFPEKKYRFLALPAVQEFGEQLDIWKQRADGTEKIINSEPWKKAQGVDYVPDYPNDLNAMHEAEKKLFASRPSYYERAYFYAVILVESGIDVASEGTPDLRSISTCIHAAAAQRSEALCRTLWPERFEK